MPIPCLKFGPLEGAGYDLHWDLDVEISDKYYWRNTELPVKYEWEQGDSVYIPPMTAHQHFNKEGERKSRFLAASHRAYKYLVGYPGLEQPENVTEGE